MSKIKRKLTFDLDLLFCEFLAEKETLGLSKRTLQNYESSYKKYVSEIGKTISKESIEKWIKSLIDKKMNPISINHYVTHLRVFAYWFMNKGYCRPFVVKKIKTQEPQLKTLSDEEIVVLLEKPSLRCIFSIFRSWVIINFILGTGARVSTITNLKVEDVDFSNKEIRYTHLKNKQSAIVPMSQSLERILKTYLNTWDLGKGYLFPSKHGVQLTSSALEQSLRRYVVGRGIKYKGAHSFRHTFAKKYIVNGGNAFILQRLLTHSDLSMTKKYVRLFSSDLHKDYDSLCPLDSYDTHSTIKRKNN